MDRWSVREWIQRRDLKRDHCWTRLHLDNLNFLGSKGVFQGVDFLNGDNRGSHSVSNHPLGGDDCLGGRGSDGISTEGGPKKIGRRGD